MTKKDFEAFLEIFTDEPNEKLTKEILAFLLTQDIKEYYYTEGTNLIRAFTKGDKSEISEKVTKIEKAPHVKKVIKEILVPV